MLTAVTSLLEKCGGSENPTSLPSYWLKGRCALVHPHVIPQRKPLQTQVENPVVTLGSSTAHLRHDFDLLIPTLEGQGEDLGAPIGHGGWLAVNHQVHPAGLRRGRLGVLLRTDHVEGLRNGRDRGRVGGGGGGNKRRL